MKKKTGILLIVLCILAVQASWLYAKDPSPDQLVAEHLKSIGGPDLLSQIKSISFVGTSEVNFILGMSGQLSGTAMIMSQGPQMAIVMGFPDVNYPEEYFAYDGNSVNVANIKPGLRSPVADFVFRYNKIMKNGILGGVFSNAWPLLDVKGNRPNMRVRKAKIDGAELYELEYNPRDRHGEMRIRMYFDPETYRHVRTEYRVQARDDVTTGVNVTDVDKMQVPGMPTAQIRGESFYTLVEKFDDFKKVGALTMPHSYTLDYMIDGSNQSGFIANWKINVLEVGFNAPNIDPNFFKAGK